MFPFLCSFFFSPCFIFAHAFIEGEKILAFDVARKNIYERSTREPKKEENVLIQVEENE